MISLREMAAGYISFIRDKVDEKGRLILKQQEEFHQLQQHLADCEKSLAESDQDTKQPEYNSNEDKGEES